MNTLKGIEIVAKSNLDKVLSNGYIMAIVKIFLAVYIARIAPEPPVYISNIFKNTYFKIFAIALIAYLVEVDFQLAILLAILFVIGMNLLSGRQALESYMNSSGDIYSSLPMDWDKSQSQSRILESKSDNYPGCANVTIADLLNIFNGDAIKLQKHVQGVYQDLMSQLTETDAKSRLNKIAIAAGLNSNVPFTDANAPFIATILLNRGYTISDTCKPPYE